jgi:hypothetical protein
MYLHTEFRLSLWFKLVLTQLLNFYAVYIRGTAADVSKVPAAFMFRIKAHFYHEDGGSGYLRNVRNPSSKRCNNARDVAIPMYSLSSLIIIIIIILLLLLLL